MIAGTHSSVGKSSVAIGLMRSLKRKNVNIKPFKVGPDYIDPSHHALASAMPSYNLDTWMCSPRYIRQLCADILGDDGIAVVEGVMGLFDGAYSKKNKASSAEIASILKLPVVLVVDGKAMARSVAALVNGYVQFDPSLEFLGVIANRVNSPGHAKILKDAIEHYTSAKFLGYLPDKPDLKINNRHLGLFQGHEQKDKLYDLWADHIDKHIDINYLIKRSCKIKISIKPSKSKRNRWGIKQGSPFTVAIAKDDAFQFIYQDTLDMFRQAGGDIKFFSPLNDRSLPDDIDWIYLPGGYPELYAKKLSLNKSMLRQIHQFSEAGKPIVAECGGLMYLGKSIIDESGKEYTMADLFKFSTTMLPKRLTLGYREFKYNPSSKHRSILLKGHEFHFSSLINNLESPQMTQYIGNKIQDGYRHKNCYALYSHIYWAGSPHWLKFITGKIGTHKEEKCNEKYQV